MEGVVNLINITKKVNLVNSITYIKNNMFCVLSTLVYQLHLAKQGKMLR